MSSGAAMTPSLPSRSYIDPSQFSEEKTRIFAREWMAACRSEEVPGPGDFHVVDLLGESVLIRRGADGGLRAHHNVCRHRGARLCLGEGARKWEQANIPDAVSAAGHVRCPYHGWVYDADGALVAAPHIGDDPALDHEQFSLYPVGLAEWGGFVFLRLDPDAGAHLDAQIGEAGARINNYPLGDLRIGHRIDYEVDANWKIICENYNECYHCGPVHPELCALVPAFRNGGGQGLDWLRGIPHRDGAVTFTWTGQSPRAPFPGLDQDELVRHKGELIYPNLFLSLARDHVAAFIIHPKGPASTRVECLFLFAADEVVRADFDHSDASGFWDTVNRQDWAICERVQLGMTSSVHTQGYYAPMEDANLDMRRYVHERLNRP